MQTFLPYPTFQKSASILDYRRLGKQRVEAKQILQILLGETESKAWKNHPAVRMWRGFEYALSYYGQQMCRVWIYRGYNDSLTPYFDSRVIKKFSYPDWLGTSEFHRSHQSNLVRKDEQYYRKYFPCINPFLPYHWPI